MSAHPEAHGERSGTDWAPPERPGGEAYVSAAGLARARRGMLARWIPVSAVRAAMGFGIARQLASSHNDIDGVAQLVVRERDLAVVRAIGLLAFVVIAVVFIVWTHRVYRNLVRLGACHRHSTGWAI